MKEVKVTEHGVARTDTDFLLRCALQRRGLALHIARVLKYETNERWVHVLFGGTDEAADRWNWARNGAHVAPRGRRALAPRGRVLSGRCAFELIWRDAR